MDPLIKSQLLYQLSYRRAGEPRKIRGNATKSRQSLRGPAHACHADAQDPESAVYSTRARPIVPMSEPNQISPFCGRYCMCRTTPPVEGMPVIEKKVSLAGSKPTK